VNGNTDVELSAGSDLIVSSGCELRLSSGGLIVALKGPPSIRTLAVKTPHATVEAHGTVFGVRTGAGRAAGAARSGATLVETYEGEVAVRRSADDARVALAEGQQVRVTDSRDKGMAVARISGLEGVRRGPDGEILRQYTWDFGGGLPQGFEVMRVMKAGEWKRQSETQTGYGRAGTSVWGDLAVKLPITLRGKPVRITLDAHLRGDLGEGQGYEGSIRYYPETSRKVRTRGVRAAGNVPWFRRSWMCGTRTLTLKRGKRRFNDKRDVYALTEYLEPADALMLVARNLCVHAIRIEELRLDESPGPLRSDASWEALKKIMTGVHSFNVAGPPEGRRPYFQTERVGQKWKNQRTPPRGGRDIRPDD
jgi:hypothetical protein